MKTFQLIKISLAAGVLGLLASTTQAQLQIAFSATENGHTRVSFSGIVRPSVLGEGYNSASSMYTIGQALVFDGDTIRVATVNDSVGVNIYEYSGVQMVGTTPTSSINSSGEPLEWTGNHGVGFSFNGSSLGLYDGSTNHDWVDWEGCSFVVPQSMAEIGLVENSSGSMTFYYRMSSLEVVTIAWSVGSAVPEPATYAVLLTAGILGFTLLRRRRRAARA